MSCNGKVAIVTGAAGKGIGRSIALTLAREGARLVVNYRKSKDMAQRVVDHVNARGAEAISVQADVAIADGCESLVRTTVAKFGQVDICIINPGAGWHPEPPDKLDSSAAQSDIQAEVSPILHLAPLVLPGMYKRKTGRLIGISLNRAFPSPAYAYNVAKSARTQSLLQMHRNAWKHNVTVNVIAPGPVAGIEEFKTAVELCEHGAAWENRLNNTPQDIAEAVSFLCSDSGRFISGLELPYMFH